MSGATPILIGGDFTPTWHVPRCPCDACVAMRAALDGFHEAFLALPDAEKDRLLVAARGETEKKARATERCACSCSYCRRY